MNANCVHWSWSFVAQSCALGKNVLLEERRLDSEWVSGAVVGRKDGSVSAESIVALSHAAGSIEVGDLKEPDQVRG